MRTWPPERTPEWPRRWRSSARSSVFGECEGRHNLCLSLSDSRVRRRGQSQPGVDCPRADETGLNARGCLCRAHS
jgi:hypothetical protein